MINPFTFCISEDSQLLSMEVESLLQKSFPKENSFKKKTYWGTEDLPSFFWNDLQSVSFFATPHIIIIRKANELSPAIWKIFSNTLMNLQKTRILFFFLENKTIPKHIKESVCYQHAYTKKWIIEKTKLTQQTIAPFIQHYITSKGFRIENKNIEYLAKILPCDAHGITTELDKIMISSDSALIDKTLLDNVLSCTPEYTIWNILDSILQGKNILTLLNTIETASFFLLSSLIQKELHIYMQFILGVPPNLPNFIYKQKEKIASSLTINKVTTIFTILSEAEYKIKTGSRTEKQSLEYTLLSIQEIFLNKNI